MYLIKLSAIPSTNDYLKKLSKNQTLENFTVVHADYQTHGKGQMGTTWIAQPSKSLTFSIFIKHQITHNHYIFSLNVWVSSVLFSVLKKYNILKISIKWPNDIMAENKKIAGILIENTLQSDGGCTSIIGIGCNVLGNLTPSLPHAGSIASTSGIELNINQLRNQIVYQLKNTWEEFLVTNGQQAWNTYKEQLFKKNQVSAFKLAHTQEILNGKILDVLPNGRLQVLFEDDSIKDFGIKEIQLIY